MLDSSSKLQSGILSGNYIDLGNFDECLSATYKTSDIGQINGQYCLIRHQIDVNRRNELLSEIYDIENSTLEVNIENPKNILVAFAICIPESCTKNEIETAIQYLKEKNIVSLINPRVMCTRNEKSLLNAADWSTMYIKLLLHYFIYTDIYKLYAND